MYKSQLKEIEISKNTLQSSLNEANLKIGDITASKNKEI